jgi:hypothetical protein
MSHRILDPSESEEINNRHTVSCPIVELEKVYRHWSHPVAPQEQGVALEKGLVFAIKRRSTVPLKW